MIYPEPKFEKTKNPIFDGRYEILSIITQNERRVVYKVQCLIGEILDEPKVSVLKLINNTDTNAAFRQMNKEALAILSSRNKNVIRLENHQKTGDLSYIVVEYVERGDIKKIFSADDTLIDKKLAISLFRQLLNGLKAIHRAGVIHRNIKPENLLLTEENILKIADFSKCYLKYENLELKKLTGSKNLYLPSGVSKYLDSQIIDLYSACGCFYYFLTKSFPFEGKNFEEIQASKKQGNFIELNRFRGDLDLEYLDFFKKAFSSDIEQGFSTINAIEKELDKLESLDEPEIYDGSYAEKKEKFSQEQTSDDEQKKEKVKKENTKRERKKTRFPTFFKQRIDREALKQKLKPEQSYQLPVSVRVGHKPSIASNIAKYIFILVASACVLLLTLVLGDYLINQLSNQALRAKEESSSKIEKGVQVENFEITQGKLLSKEEILELFKSKHSGAIVGLFDRYSSFPMYVVNAGESANVIIAREGFYPEVLNKDLLEKEGSFKIVSGGIDLSFYGGGLSVGSKISGTFKDNSSGRWGTWYVK